MAGSTLAAVSGAELHAAAEAARAPAPRVKPERAFAKHAAQRLLRCACAHLHNHEAVVIFVVAVKQQRRAAKRARGSHGAAPSAVARHERVRSCVAKTRREAPLAPGARFRRRTGAERPRVCASATSAPPRGTRARHGRRVSDGGAGGAASRSRAPPPRDCATGAARRWPAGASAPAGRSPEAPPSVPRRAACAVAGSLAAEAAAARGEARERDAAMAHKLAPAGASPPATAAQRRTQGCRSRRCARLRRLR